MSSRVWQGTLMIASTTGSAEYLPRAQGRTGRRFAGKMHSVGAGGHGQRSRFCRGNIHQQLGTVVVDLLHHLAGERLEIGRSQIFLPQLDEMYAPGCPALHQTEKLPAKNRFGLSFRLEAPAVRYGTELHGVESILHVS